jgi:hypothetical protein
MPTAQQCHAAITYYEKAYTEHYDKKPVINRHTARWGFDSVLRDLSPTECKELIDYYFQTGGNHALDWFFYNYDKLLIARSSQVANADERSRLREESKQRVKEWRERGRQGITGNKLGIEE